MHNEIKDFYFILKINNQKKGIISLILYNHDKFALFTFIDISLNTAGNKYKINGYKRPNIKLEIESLINAL